MSAASKRGLGRGLEALLGDDDLNFDIDISDNEKGIKTLKISELKAGKFQPRTEFNESQINALANSIKEKGVLQPILVRKIDSGYEIVAGERRYRAAQIAGLTEIPVIEKQISDNEALEIALIENIVRQNLNDIEEAMGLASLIDKFSYTQEKLSQVIGKSRSYIANSLRLLTLPEEIKQLLKDKKLSAGHARALIGCKNAIVLAQKIIKEGLNVRQTEDLVSKAKNNIKQDVKPKKVVDEELFQIEKNLTQKIGLKVQIKTGKSGKGKVVLNYKDLSELENIINKLEK